MAKKTKLVFFMLFLALFTVIALNQAVADWQCHGVCYGCWLACDADELSECCGFCEVGGDRFECCFPDECWIKI